MSDQTRHASAEMDRLGQDTRREQNWKRWGPYLSERQWATVREDYSADGDVWEYLPHDHARSRAYRWAKTAYWGFVIVSAGCVLPWRCGMGGTRFSRNDFSV